MDELIFIQESLRKGQLNTLLLYRVLNFSDERPRQPLHSLRWRFFLGILPLNVDFDTYGEVWIAQTKKSEAKWLSLSEGLKQRSQTTAATANQGRKRGQFGYSDSDEDFSEDDVAENPLLPTEGSFYALRYQVETIQETIKKDLSRLHWDLSIFQDPLVHDILLDILTNYCVRHDCEYKQGMHEIAAFIFYTIHHDALFIRDIEEKDDSRLDLLKTFGIISSPSNVTALTFELFETLMTSNGLNLASWYYGGVDSASNDIISASQLVQGTYLAPIDPSLHYQLNTVYEIEGTSYLIRWFRLLFLREFSFSQCATLWDIFFLERFLVKGNAFRLDESTVTFVAVSMLLVLKKDLMVGRIEALLRLMKYPSVCDIALIIQKTMEQVDSKKNDMRRYFTPPTYKATCFDTCEGKKFEIQYAENKVVPLSSSTNAKMVSQGVALSSIIESLEKIWLPSSSLPSHEKERLADNYLVAIAQLKRVRDVLLSRVDDES